MDYKTVSRCLKIHTRLSKNSAALRVIAKLDDVYGSTHALATIQGLEILTSKCFVNNNPATSMALTTWAAESFLAEVEAGNLEAAPRKEIITAAVNRALLRRRVIQYLLRKFHIQSAGFEKLRQTLASPKTFHESGLSSSTSDHVPFLKELPAYWQGDLLGFIMKIMSGAEELDEVWTDAVQQDATVQAETVLSSAAFLRKGALDMPLIIQDHKNFTEPPVVPIEKAPAIDPEQPVSSAPPEEEMPLADEPAMEEAPRKPELDRRGFFQELVLPDIVDDVFNRVDDQKFRELLEWSQLRALATLSKCGFCRMWCACCFSCFISGVKLFVSLEVRPNTPAEWHDCLRALADEFPGPKAFLYDCKNEARAQEGDLETQPYKRPPSILSKEFKGILDGLLLAEMKLCYCQVPN